MNADFTRQDLDILFDAVERWEQDDMSSEIMGAMLEGIMSDRSPEVQAKLQAAREEREFKRKAAQRQRKERAVLIKAKLIALKDSLDAKAFSETT
jgi:hypothetical protein